MTKYLRIREDWFHRSWVCFVVRSGYHNGSECKPGDPHFGWGCGWRCEVSLREEDFLEITGGK
jgi:hypothetical protein